MESKKDSTGQAKPEGTEDNGFNYMILNSIQGEQGNQGNQGFQGDQGYQGNQGFQGDKGNQGDQGNRGNQGFQGDKGNQGDQGFHGNQGFQGDQGNQGFQGDKGNQGDQGIQGNQGNQGYQGSNGNQGNQGFQGFQGSQGNQGASGSGGVPQGGVILSGSFNPPEGFINTGIRLLPSSLSRNVSARNPMPVSRMWASAISVLNKVYVIGGKNTGSSVDSYSNLVQVYDTEKDTWSNMAPLPSGRYGATAILQFSSALYVFGGTQDGLNYMRNNDANLAETNGHWQDMGAPMPLATAGALGVAKGMLMYILGGTYNGPNAILQSYNASTKTWSAAKNTPVPQFTGGATVLVNSNMYILGASTQRFQVSSSAPIYGYYNLDTNIYTPIPLPPAPSNIFFPSAVLTDDKIYLIGGYRSDGLLSTQIFMLDYKSNSWYAHNLHLPHGSTSAVAGTGNDAFFVMGGGSTLNGPAIADTQGTNSNTFYLMQKT